ncbi:uncharacterized protein LOC127876462 [Dreissena polymorpha]|uniref:uncharacterized protein LOC127876462 n=1 Tax=Dreissena polymorpha TaxID=45954 RepID=UPI0022653241|nr:uncharacterized protein LOC127876462 [Dreissena polymorpha]
MELEGLKRGIAALQEMGIQIKEIVTDRHMQIQKWLRDNHHEIKHSYDVWHVAKAVKKKLVALSKQKDCDHLFKWIKSITNHLYWAAASTSDEDGAVIVSKWKSVSNHIQNIHHRHDGPFTDSQHEELADRDWLKPGSKAAVKVEEIVLSKRLCTDVAKLSTGYQTSTLESFHATINHFAPKMMSFSYHGQACRQIIAALHFNENVHREVATNTDGTEKHVVVFPKYKSGDDFSMKPTMVDQTFDYVDKLMNMVFEICESNQPTVMATPAPPPLTNGKRRPTEEELQTVVARRFKRLCY